MAENKTILERANQIRDLMGNLPEDVKGLVNQLAYDAAYWESLIKELREYPMYLVHPTDKTRIKSSPASRQLERAQAQYNQIIKTLVTIYTRAGGGDESDLLDEMLNEFKDRR